LVDVHKFQFTGNSIQQRRSLQTNERTSGTNVPQDLAKAIAELATRQGRLERCMAAMEMQIPKAVLWQKIRSLQKMLP
jgi:hypothetical protein